jgi:pyruvate-formate lyase-activating enzyme
VNVVGGSVESFESLSFLITYLKSEGIKVRFWNQGVVDVDVIEGILDRCDEIILYCPSVDERLYQELSHESTFEEFKDCVDRLKESTALCKIQTPVLVDYIGDLPDIHEFVRGHGLEWILHYHKEELNRDQKDIVARYFNIPKVDVYKVTGQGVPRCVALPFPAYKSRFYYVKNKLSNVLAKTR